MKKAMITIEVLISMLILFLVIATSFSSIKFFNIQIDKRQLYEEKYINILSLKDKLSSTICKTSFSQEGILNGYEYSANCTKIKELRTYKKAFEDDEVAGNFGNFMIKLYRVNVTLKKGNRSQNENYLITRSEKLL